MSDYELMWNLSWRSGVLLLLLGFVELLVVGTPVPVEYFYPGLVLAATGVTGPVLELYAGAFARVGLAGRIFGGGEGE